MNKINQKYLKIIYYLLYVNVKANNIPKKN